MRLIFDEPACSDCGACLSICPKNPASKDILRCKHCSPEIAPCKIACPSGAIKESKGILFIDEDECTGCGACMKACPQHAIVLKDGKAVKCDLCFGSPKCVDYCPEEALRFVKQESGLLGWRISEDNPGYGTGIPRLTREEQALILEAVSRFRESSKRCEFSTSQDVKVEVDNILAQFCRDNGIALDKEQLQYITGISVMQIWGYGPLDPMLRDPELEEIAVIGLNKPVYVYKRGEGWLTTDCQFTDQEIVLNIINKMARHLGRRLTYQNPRLNAVLQDGSRIHASMPPISNLELTIRKFRENPISVPDLIGFKTFSPDSLAFLWMAVKLDLSIIVAGNTASGKTSTLNALFSFVPLDERILITEETPEINIPHRHRVNLLANKELGIGMGDLMADSLRMRPDRVIVGEVRTPEETRALIEAITSGQAKGSYATFHAQSANEAIVRMRSLGIPDIDMGSIDIIVIQKRMALKKQRETRRTTEISEVSSDGNSTKAVPIYLYDHSSNSLKRTGNPSRVEGKIMRTLALSQGDIKKDMHSRASFLFRLSKKKTSFFETVAAIQNYDRSKGEAIDGRPS